MPIKTSDVWYARFPFEENPKIYKERPVIVMGIRNGSALALATMVTTHAPRDYFDVVLHDNIAAGLHKPSVARVSRTLVIPEDDFLHYIGMLSNRDFKSVSSKLMEFVGD